MIEIIKLFSSKGKFKVEKENSENFFTLTYSIGDFCHHTFGQAKTKKRQEN
jgi:hypothetical protein